MLPRLKYYNPAVKMVVSRPQDMGGEAMMRVYVKKDKSSSTSTTITSPTDAASASAEAQGETAKAPFKPVEFDEHYVAEATSAIPPPNKSFDEDVVEINMKDKADIQIWQNFMSSIPVTPVEPALGEIETVKELQAGKEERADKAAGEDDGKKWLEMFKREQSRVRAMEEQQVGQFAAMKAKADAEKMEYTQGVLGVTA